MIDEWKPYHNDRLIKQCDGFVVIKPIDAAPCMPLCCSLCELLFRTSDDEEAYDEFGCCHFCALAWAHPRRQVWHEGWRPTKEQIEQEVQSRPPRKLIMIVD